MKPIEGEANGIRFVFILTHFPPIILLLFLLVNFSFRVYASLHPVPAPYISVDRLFGKHSESL